jgi:hypothetical protein
VAIVGGAVGLLGSVTGRLPSIIAAMFYPTAVGTPNSKGQSTGGGIDSGNPVFNAGWNLGNWLSNGWNWVSQHTNGWA